MQKWEVESKDGVNKQAETTKIKQAKNSIDQKQKNGNRKNEYHTLVAREYIYFIIIVITTLQNHRFRMMGFRKGRL
jgi:hypothetical protein